MKQHLDGSMKYISHLIIRGEVMSVIEEMLGYKGRIVAITGGAGVISGFMAEGFLQAGANVLLCGRNIINLTTAS